MSLEIADREIIAYLGMSSSGKTTTMSMVAVIGNAAPGKIFIGDRVGKRILSPRARTSSWYYGTMSFIPT